MRPQIIVDSCRDGLIGVAVEYWKRFVVYLAVEMQDGDFKGAGEVDVGLQLAGVGAKTGVIRRRSQ